MALIVFAVQMDGGPVVEVITGNASRGAGLTSLPATVPPSSSRFRTFSVRDNRGLPAEFDIASGMIPMEMVVQDELHGLSVISFKAALIFGASGANWSSTITIPSSPTETPIFPPEPSSM